jgi:hypothetical protein
MFPKSVLYWKVEAMFQDAVGVDGVSNPHVGRAGVGSQAGEVQQAVGLVLVVVLLGWNWGIVSMSSNSSSFKQITLIASGFS